MNAPAEVGLVPLPAVVLPPSIRPATDLGPSGEFRWLDVGQLVVDVRYQRDISERGDSLIRRMVAGFAWAKFPPLTVAPVAREKFAVVDGQHRAIAAAAHPYVTRIPAWIIEAGDVAAQAAAFVSANRDRTSVTPTQLYYANLAAGDADALHLKAVLDGAGVRVQKTSHPDGARPLHTLAVSTLYMLLRQHGDGPVARALAALADAHPDKRNQFGALTLKAFVRVTADTRVPIDPAVLTAAAVDINAAGAERKARAERDAHGGDPVAAYTARIWSAYQRHYAKKRRAA